MSTPERTEPASDGPSIRRTSRAWEHAPERPVPLPAPSRWEAGLRPLLRWLRRLPGRALHPSTLRDRALVRRLHAALAASPSVDDLGHVRVYVAHGVVTLAGRVATDEARRSLLRRVSAVRGVHAVEASGVQIGMQ